MGDCFPKTGGGFPIPEQCRDKTGNTEYGSNYKQWCSPVLSTSFVPDQAGDTSELWKQRYSFSKGPRFGVPPYCDCTPPPERFRFDTTYNHDFTPCVHKDPNTKRLGFVPGVRPQYGTFLPKQFLCPFTNESTYARAYDMPQAHYRQVCSQNEPCGGGGCNEGKCCQEECQSPCSPCGLELRYTTRKAKPRPYRPPLRRECLIPPGTDTSDCCACPKPLECCPCPEGEDWCNPCGLHQGATTPERKYAEDCCIPKFVPDPRDVPERSRMLCGGGTCECPTEPQFPSKLAIKHARYRLLDELEKERCRFPPECVESLYRASYKFPPYDTTPTYCAKEQIELVKKMNAEVAQKGLPPSCIPSYCIDGGKPPDWRPAFDHFSTYQTDYIMEKKNRFKMLGGEIGCEMEVKPLCCPMMHASELFPERTEEKERWGDDWECCPPPN